MREAEHTPLLIATLAFWARLNAPYAQYKRIKVCMSAGGVREGGWTRVDEAWDEERVKMRKHYADGTALFLFHPECKCVHWAGLTYTYAQATLSMLNLSAEALH